MRTQDSADQRRVNRRRRAFPAHIPNRNSQPRKRVGNKVVEIASNRARRHKLCLHFQMPALGKGIGQQTELQFARQRQFPLQARLSCRAICSYSRAFSMAIASCAASVVRTRL